MMDVGLYRRRVNPDFSACLNLLVPGVVDVPAVDRLPSLFRQGFDVLLENRLAGILPHLQTGEAAES